jgi:DNA-binding MarR family transcriptional regulator/GNAT superfamily N-acetyltransferase
MSDLSVVFGFVLGYISCIIQLFNFRKMQNVSSSYVPEIRTASRELVRELGFMSRTLAGTDLGPSGVHAIIEIGSTEQLSAKELCEKLLLDKSTVSRLVASLISKGELCEVRSGEDARIKHIHLTRQGEKTLAAIIRFAEQQVEAAVTPLADKTRKGILVGLQQYSNALKVTRMAGGDAVDVVPAIIKEGYTPSLIGRIVGMHASYYARQVGFGSAFEIKVANELSDFVIRLEAPENAIWYARKSGAIVGSIAIDGQDLQDGQAHLRWFIVDKRVRGTGVGNKLMRRAMAFRDKRAFSETQLWTFRGLDAARRLYEKHGFKLAHEYEGDQWGAVVQEQKFVRPQIG